VVLIYLATSARDKLIIYNQISSTKVLQSLELLVLIYLATSERDKLIMYNQISSTKVLQSLELVLIYLATSERDKLAAKLARFTHDCDTQVPSFLSSLLVQKLTKIVKLTDESTNTDYLLFSAGSFFYKKKILTACCSQLASFLQLESGLQSEKAALEEQVCFTGTKVLALLVQKCLSCSTFLRKGGVRSAGTQFICFTGTKVQTLTLRA